MSSHEPPDERRLLDQMRCSFCGKRGTEVDGLIAGATTQIAICNACIALCTETLAEEPTGPTWHAESWSGRGKAPGAARRADQAWFWTGRWQAMEREVDEDVAADRLEVFVSAAEFIADLDRQIADADDTAE